MMQMAKAASVISRDELLGRIGQTTYNKGYGEFSHEMAHNVQNPLWLFAGALEPTAELSTIYFYEKFYGIPGGVQPPLLPRKPAPRRWPLRLAHPNFERWNDRWLGTTTYVLAAAGLRMGRHQRVWRVL